MTGPPVDQVVAVVPVKRLGEAKTRLAVPPEQRRSLALAFAADTIAALTGSALVAGVVVVTSDQAVTDRVRDRSVHVVGETGRGLDAAVSRGVVEALSWRSGLAVAVVPGDLPGLRPDDVTQVVSAALATGAAFVPDRAGTGTTFLVQLAARVGVARYGPGSARRHAEQGLVSLRSAPVRARHDVDTVADLRDAVPLGLGPETARLVAGPDLREALGPVSPRWQTTP